MHAGLTGELVCPGSHSHPSTVETRPLSVWKNNQVIVTDFLQEIALALVVLR